MATRTDDLGAGAFRNRHRVSYFDQPVPPDLRRLAQGSPTRTLFPHIGGSGAATEEMPGSEKESLRAKPSAGPALSGAVGLAQSAAFFPSMGEA